MVRELIAVVARAALQWAMSSLLLANGAAFCLIAAAASWLRLAPPCLLCAGVHRLLCSAASADARSQERAAFGRLLCDVHVAAIAAAAASEPEKKQQQQQEQEQKMLSASDGAEEKIDGAEAPRIESMVRSLFFKTLDGGLYDHRGLIQNIIYDLILSEELIQQIQTILTSISVVIFLRHLRR